MKGLLCIILGTIVTIQLSQAQTPINIPDNIGSGNCLDFDGNTDFVNVPNIPSYDFGSGDFTAQVWVMYNDVMVHTSAITTMNDNGATVGYVISIQADGRVYFFLGCGTQGAPCNGNGFGVGTPYTISAGVWHNISIVKRGTIMELYDDGELAASATIPVSVRTLTSGEDINIGRRFNDILCCKHNGQLDEVRIWNRALTQTEIRDNMCKALQGNESGLVGYWNMNEGIAGTVTDLTSNSNDGTLQ